MKKLTLSSAILAMALVSPPAVAQQSWTADNGNGSFTNPLFYDEFSDPDIIRVGNDFYLAGTTMHCLPGIVVLHSTDLVNWRFCSYAMDSFNLGDEFRLDNGKEAYGQGIWAPCIRYHNGKFYIFSNINGHGMQVFIAEKAEGPWQHINMKGNIYDLSVLFDDDGKIYAIHKYGAVHITEIKPDFSGFVEGSDRVIIPEGNAMGEGHHAYKINGKYYILSADYSPMGRMQCARADKLEGPYETCVISAMETYGTPTGRSVRNVGLWQPLPDNGFKYDISNGGGNYMGCATIHQGGIVSTPDGKEWWGISMQDFRSVGRTVCLSPITWKDGWPYFGIEGNLGRSPKTWVKPSVNEGLRIKKEESAPHSPYERCDDFSGKNLKPIWQWNHEPQKGMWALKGGTFHIKSQPAKNLLWAKNSLTQRGIGPVSTTTVLLDASRLKDGDVAGLGLINTPYSYIAAAVEGKTISIRCYDQNGDKTLTASADGKSRIWFRMTGDFEDDKAQLSYSTDGTNFTQLGGDILMPYQLKTFQGTRLALFAYNEKNCKGGEAIFDDYIVSEPLADRSQNLPTGKVITLTNLADGSMATALPHGMLHIMPNGAKDFGNSSCQFRVHDRGNGRVVLEALNGMGFLTVVGEGLSADVRFFKQESDASLIQWQDMLHGQCMLLSLKTGKYVGIYPTTGAPYSADLKGSDPDRKNGCVFKWNVVE